MVLRTCYWNSRKASYYHYYKNKFLKEKKNYFLHGNSGDIFNIDLINYVYGLNHKNLSKSDNRLLMVGSLMNLISKGDVVNGIGWKGNDLSSKQEEIEKAIVYGVRGPLTKRLFEKYNTDLSFLKFEYDPGLLIKEVYNLKIEKNNSDKPVFLPHYNDIEKYNGNYPSNIRIISMDNKPKKIASVISKASIVYSSSLHGIIFSHALGKECVFVKPQSDEPLFKYRDYYYSVGLDLPQGLKNIYSINFFLNKGTVLEREIGLKDFYFPNIKKLHKLNLIDH